MTEVRNEYDKPSGTMIVALTTGSWTSLTPDEKSERSGNSVGLLTMAVLSLETTVKSHH